jgi:hypothetical protein
MLALVYAEGSQTRWVELLIEGPHHEWFQTVNYFYGTDNRLQRRERYLDQVPANTSLQEFLYYEHGRMFTKTSRHHPLKAGREDNSQFDDPNAPEFGSVEELPFPQDADAERRLAFAIFTVSALVGRPFLTVRGGELKEIGQKCITKHPQPPLPWICEYPVGPFRKRQSSRNQAVALRVSSALNGNPPDEDRSGGSQSDKAEPGVPVALRG